MELVELNVNKKKVNVAYERIKSELTEKKSFLLTSEDVINLIKNKIVQQNDGNTSALIKKVNCEINDNIIKIETVIDLSSLVAIKAPKKVKPILDLINAIKVKNRDFSGELYVSFQGEPFNENGTIQFRGETIVTIGDFLQEMNFDETDGEFVVSRIFRELKINNFEMLGDKIGIYQ